MKDRSDFVTINHMRHLGCTRNLHLRAPRNSPSVCLCGEGKSGVSCRNCCPPTRLHRRVIRKQHFNLDRLTLGPNQASVSGGMENTVGRACLHKAEPCWKAGLVLNLSRSAGGAGRQSCFSVAVNGS